MENSLFQPSFEDCFHLESQPLVFTTSSHGSIGTGIDPQLQEPYTPNSGPSTPEFSFATGHDGLPPAAYEEAIQPLEYEYIPQDLKPRHFSQSILSPPGDYVHASYDQRQEYAYDGNTYNAPCPSTQYDNAQYVLGPSWPWQMAGNPNMFQRQTPPIVVGPPMEVPPMPTPPKNTLRQGRRNGRNQTREKNSVVHRTRKSGVSKREQAEGTVLIGGRLYGVTKAGTHDCPHEGCANTKGFKRREHLKRHILT